MWLGLQYALSLRTVGVASWVTIRDFVPPYKQLMAYVAELKINKKQNIDILYTKIF